MELPYEPVRVGVIGCGTISGRYLTVMRTLPILRIVACADLLLDRARARAEEFDVPRACTVTELLADPSVELVVNLTVPQAHGDVGLAALRAGKSVYNEKPLATTRADARALLEHAQPPDLLVGAAPDTFLGGGLQTCRKLIDDGWIGQPVAAVANVLTYGPESWHADPAFYYQPGAGPMLDMGPYYLTALVALLGPIRRVAGMTASARPHRVITSEPLYGTPMSVNTPTHIAGVIEFAQGSVATLTTSFDAPATTLPPIEIHGTEGSLLVPDPNTFGGPVRLRRRALRHRDRERERDDWLPIPLTHGYTTNSRSLGVADMAYALRAHRSPRASGTLAYHVLDVMLAFAESAQTGQYVEIASACSRPDPLPLGLLEDTLDA